MPVRFIIPGQPFSKSNSRRLVTHWNTGRAMFIKSKEALAYLKEAEKHIPRLPALLLGPVRVSIKIFYASERPDLDPSLILDAMQGKIYGNDRQVREMHLWHAIDRHNPRSVIEVEPIQADMLAERVAA